MANDTYFSKLPKIIKAIASGDAALVELMDETHVHTTARYVRQILLLQADDIPFTTGCKTVADEIEHQSTTPAEIGEQLVTALTAEIGDKAYSVKKDPRKGEKYISVIPGWWAKAELEAALALAAS